MVMVSKSSKYILWLSASLIGMTQCGIARPASLTFAQPLEGSCYVDAGGQCFIDVDNFTVQVNESSGERAAEFVLRATNINSGMTTVLWSFHTSSSYGFKPVGDYTPTMPPNDFAAQCATTYSLSILTDRKSVV